jgi:hypothetical protein
VDADIAALLEPINEHLKAVMCKLFAYPICFLVAVTEVASGVIFFDSHPKYTI